ncbi:MAG TPA: hypothetical protein DEP80_01845 [Anaerolineae bacterium]|nr:hypothetical protein [Anaerolineae bacterium]HCC78336.1 hypothetical protein [Anaerolineae bacterium]HCM97713.1 hypothetical protein [Anaerolineae bacterium]
MQSVPVDKQMIFLMQYNGKKKNPILALLLAYFLGGFGAHKFYIGQNDLGIIYLLFCWTGFPSLIALIECFWISSVISKINRRKALEIATLIGGGSLNMYM